METNPLPPPGEMDAVPGVSTPPDSQPPVLDPRAPDGEPRGLSKHLRKALVALRRAGFQVGYSADTAAAAPAVAAVDAALGTGSADTASPAVAMESRPAFDEAVTRTGVQGLVDTADNLAVAFVTTKATDAVGDRDGRRFGERVAMTPAIKEGIVNAGVEVCRIEGVNVPPHATLAVLTAGWLYGVFAVVRELKALQGQRPAAAAPSSAAA